MSVIHTWYTDQESPGFPIALYDYTGETLLNLSSGYTITLQVVRPTSSSLRDFIVVTQSTSLTLYDAVGEAYNATLDKWASGTLTAIETDLLTTLGRASQQYEFRPYIRRTSDSADEVPTSHVPLFGVFRLAAA